MPLAHESNDEQPTGLFAASCPFIGKSNTSYGKHRRLICMWGRHLRPTPAGPMELLGLR